MFSRQGLRSRRITSVCSWNRFRGPARCKTVPRLPFKQIGAAGGAGAAKRLGFGAAYLLPLLRKGNLPACALATLRSIARLATVVKRLLKRSAGAARAMVIGSMSNSSVWPKSCVGGPPRPPKTPSYSLPRSQRPLVLHYEQRNPPFWLLEGSRGVNGQQDQGLTSWATTFAPSAALLGTHSSLVKKNSMDQSISDGKRPP